MIDFDAGDYVVRQDDVNGDILLNVFAATDHVGAQRVGRSASRRFKIRTGTLPLSGFG
jgi:hypothetical protein